MQPGLEEMAGDFYEGSLDETRWASGMERLAQMAGARGAVFTLEDLDAGQSTVLHHVGQPPEAIRDYHAEFHRLAPMLARAPSVAPGEWQDWLQRSPQHRKSVYYNEFLVPHGNHSGIATVLWREGNRYACLGLQRDADQGSFEADDQRALAPIVPHLRRAARLYLATQRLREEARFRSDMLDRIQLPVFIVDSRAVVVFANHAAEALARSGDALAVVSGMLTSRTGAPALQAALQRATRTARAEGSSVRLDGARAPAPTVAVVTPLPAHSPAARPWQRPLAVVMATSTAHRSLADVLHGAFGLTPAEMRLALGLSEGLSLSDVAERHGVKVQTLRGQLKSLFWKVGVRRQAELASLMAALQPLAPGEPRQNCGSAAPIWGFRDVGPST